MTMISDVKLWPNQAGNSKVKARGNFLANNAFRIQFTLFEGSSGLYVGLPGRYGTKLKEDGSKVWYSDVFVEDQEVRKQMNEAVIQKYNETVGNGPTHQGEAPGPTSQEVPDKIPF